MTPLAHKPSRRPRIFRQLRPDQDATVSYDPETGLYWAEYQAVRLTGTTEQSVRKQLALARTSSALRVYRISRRPQRQLEPDFVAWIQGRWRRLNGGEIGTSCLVYPDHHPLLAELATLAERQQELDAQWQRLLNAHPPLIDGAQPNRPRPRQRHLLLGTKEDTQHGS